MGEVNLLKGTLLAPKKLATIPDLQHLGLMKIFLANEIKYNNSPSKHASLLQVQKS